MTDGTTAPTPNDPISWLDEPTEPAEKDSVPEVKTVAGYRETTRGQLARWLMCLLTITILALIAFAVLIEVGVMNKTPISLETLAQVILTPVATLTASALGFYFGAHNAADGGVVPPKREPGVIRKAGRWLW